MPTCVCHAHIEFVSAKLMSTVLSECERAVESICAAQNLKGEMYAIGGGFNRA